MGDILHKVSIVSTIGKFASNHLPMSAKRTRHRYFFNNIIRRQTLIRRKFCLSQPLSPMLCVGHCCVELDPGRRACENDGLEETFGK